MAGPILLLHGGGQGGWVWDGTIAALRQQAGDPAIEIVALDVPGCGTKSGRDTAGLGIADVVTELAGEIAAMDARDALIVGHSQAGTVLPGLIAASRGRIARAVYFTCCAPLEGQTVMGLIGRGIRGTSETEIGWPLDPRTTAPADLFRAAFCNDMDDAEASAFMARLGKDSWPSDCGLVSHAWGYESARNVPATYVAALGDNILPLAWQLRCAERLHADRIVHLDSGHQGMNTRAHGLAEILLAEHRAAASETSR